MTRRRVGVLISGRGSNLDALIAASRAPDYPADIVLVISNRPGVAGLEVARSAGIPALCVDHKGFAGREAFEAVLDRHLAEARADLVANAGFLRLLTGWFVARWRDRHVNIHPSLLPAFKGLDVHRRVLESGVRITGCTVHMVREAMDEGPILAQAAVPVLAGDSEASLADRVLAAEHVLYPHALALLASGRIAVRGERAEDRGGPEQPAARLVSPPP